MDKQVQRERAAEEGQGILWLRPQTSRAVLAAHLRHIRGQFLAAGWRVTVGLTPPNRVTGSLAVLDDPWVEALPSVAEFLAQAPGRGWRVPGINGFPAPQGWEPRNGPYTLRDYEYFSLTAGSSNQELPAQTAPWHGFAVAPAQEARRLLDAGWPPAPESMTWIPQARLYRYDDPAGHGRLELDPFIPNSTRVLVDIGCGHGRLGARHRGPNRQVIGIEPDWNLARQAAQRLDLVLPTTAEKGLAALRKNLDCLIFADVLEHTTDPANVLSQARASLASNGKIIVSLPNAAWAPLLRTLAAGRWDPTLAGNQARDHFVPMTPLSFQSLAEECGLVVEQTVPVMPPLPWRLSLWARIAAWSTGGNFDDLRTSQWTAVLRKR